MNRGPRILVNAANDCRALAFLGAVGRAGACGVLDLVWGGPEPLATRVSLVRRAVDGAGGQPIALRVLGTDLTEAVARALPDSLAAVIVVGLAPDGTDAAEAVARLLAAGRTPWAEVATRAAAAQAEAAGAVALIVVGHEAGGIVGDDSSFILLQAVLARSRVPVYVRGGIGPRVAAGAVAMGAAGVVLDGLTLLASDSPLGPAERHRVARWDGSETRLVGPSTGPRLRVHLPPGSSWLGSLDATEGEDPAAWFTRVRSLVGFQAKQAWPVGQDAALAATLAASGSLVGDVVRAVAQAIAEGDQAASRAGVLSEGSPLAQALGTRYPILQGPMTRVSDVPAFARAVADEGALPFLALAMLRGPAVAALLTQSQAALGDRPWGVGLLGFVDPDLRREQVAAVLAARPPFALIAGGRPDQARELDAAGITAFLHVPSPGLLDQFIRDGARRFILEGRECGGHVGPRSSFVLWEQALATVTLAVAAGIPARDFHLVFAGGVHDGPSARFVGGLASAASRLGIKVGVLVGTGYLFTREAVATGAIVARYQAEALRCGQTVLLETGPGHEVRVGPSPFVAAFGRERDRLHAAGADPDHARQRLERLNAGRLRVASKGLGRPDEDSNAPLTEVADADQFERGIYMLGQVATLRHEVGTIAALHRAIAGAAEAPEVALNRPQPQASAIAIVGMSAILPGASDVRTFWENTLAGRDSVTEVPPDRWDWRLYYDADPKAPDKVVSKWGGFVPDVPFDPLRYGMPPSSLPAIEPVQLLLLEATRAALADAGYSNRPFARERTAVVLGMGGGAAQLAMGYAFRSYLPLLDGVSPGAGQATLDACRGLLPEWTEDSFPGFLLNVAAGRVANRFDLGGANYTVDAACGSSLAAAQVAVRELESGAADVVLLGGADTVQNPFTYLAFSKTHAFSPRGRCRPFDRSADGIVISEGVAMVVLKRLADAERDGDRIYAVIRGMGSSSDGRARGLTAPSPDGQTRAVVRALDASGVDPATIGYVEAHGTGTAVGDVVEVNALAGVYRARGVGSGSVALGSVKSMIGHTKCAAGLAGLINASLALHHRVLPPTIGVQAINPKADLRDGPLRVNTGVRPWVQAGAERPRRAAVSAFGFGGTNFHAVLEAYGANSSPSSAPIQEWPAELLVWRGVDRADLLTTLDRLASGLAAGAQPRLRDLAASVNLDHPASGPNKPVGPTLAIVAESLADLSGKLDAARAALRSGQDRIDDPRGVFGQVVPEHAGAPVAFVFPGQGSQRVGMLSELVLAFPEVRSGFEACDAALAAQGSPPVGPLVFAPSPVDDADRLRQSHDLAATDRAQVALGAASVGLLRLLGSFGLDADHVAGHSFGELVALHAAGALDAVGLFRLSSERGRLMAQAGQEHPGAMAAVGAGVEVVLPLLASFGSVAAVNENGPRQTVIAGPQPDLGQAVAAMKAAGLTVHELPVAAAFHTEAMGSVREPLASLAGQLLTVADRPVYSNLDAAPHPAAPGLVAERLGEHATRPVRFGAMVAALHRDGARVFVEVGPGSVLTGLVGSVLGDQPHLAVALDSPQRPGLVALLLALGRLAAAGVAVRLDRLSEGRATQRLELVNLPVGDGLPPLPPSTWLVNGSRSRPLHAPEPRRLGQAPEILGPPRPNSPPPLLLSAPAPPNPVAQSPGPPGPGPRTSMYHGNGNGSALGNGSGHGNGSHGPVSNGSGPTHGHALPARPASPSGAPVAVTPPTGPADERVLAAFQETMRQFLDVQRATMLAYLGGRSGVAATPATGVAATAPSLPPTPAPLVVAPPPAMLPPRLTERLQARPLAPRPNPAPVVPVATPAPLATPAPVAPIPVAAIADPPSPVQAPDPEAWTRAAVAERLVAIVGDRTGYPSEMLGLDLDLEADLGIDSIKRVEILGTLRDAVPSLAAASDGAVMDSLTRARTLGSIADRVAALGRRPSAVVVPGAATRAAGSGREFTVPPVPAADGQDADGDGDGDPEPAQPPLETAGVRRLVIEALPAPLAGVTGAGLQPGGVAIITDDGGGVGPLVARRLEALGHPALLVGAATHDLGSPAAVDLILAQARARGPLAALIHALPLRAGGRAASGLGLDPRAWADRLGPEVRGLFLLAQGAAADLALAAERGGAALIAATDLGGTFLSTLPRSALLNPSGAGQGGVIGLVKTLAREWPGVRTRVVDFGPDQTPDDRAARLVAEARAQDGWSEVGTRGGERIRLQARPEPLDRRGPSQLELRPGEPIVLTGGARGITASVALELARRWQPTLLMVGRSQPPPEVEDPALASLHETGPLKAALLDRLKSRARGGLVTALELDQAYRALRQEREIRANLAALRQAGATVAYAAVDVRDAAALEALLSCWRAQFGPPVGLIHGAGVIQDKLIRAKTVASWDLVVGTKVDGALNLARLIDPAPLRFAAFFSSIAGRFGNAGQCDYAAANEVLNKLAVSLDARWPGRVVAVNWGPWSGVGMVSDLEGHLGGRGLGMIPPAVGSALLVDELRFGRKGEVEVIIAGELGTLADPIGPPPPALVAPAVPTGLTLPSEPLAWVAQPYDAGLGSAR